MPSKILKALFLMFSLLTFANFAQAADENMTVTGSRIYPDAGLRVGGIGSREQLERQKPDLREGGSRRGGLGVRKGCQECQSAEAFYTCEVWKAVPINETWDKTRIALSGQNCCAASGGNVLSTTVGACGG